jgi:hypothetical protein
VARALAPSLGDGVWCGPFAGKVYTKTIAEGFVVTKLLGCYEQELHPVIEAAIGEAAIGRVYDTIVNIRGAEGYYAIDLACAPPTVIVHAFGFLISWNFHRVWFFWRRVGPRYRVRPSLYCGTRRNP